MELVASAANWIVFSQGLKMCGYGKGSFMQGKCRNIANWDRYWTGMLFICRNRWCQLGQLAHMVIGISTV